MPSFTGRGCCGFAATVRKLSMLSALAVTGCPDPPDTADRGSHSQDTVPSSWYTGDELAAAQGCLEWIRNHRDEIPPEGLSVPCLADLQVSSVDGGIALSPGGDASPAVLAYRPGVPAVLIDRNADGAVDQFMLRNRQTSSFAAASVSAPPAVDIQCPEPDRANVEAAFYAALASGLNCLGDIDDLLAADFAWTASSSPITIRCSNIIGDCGSTLSDKQGIRIKINPTL